MPDPIEPPANPSTNPPNPVDTNRSTPPNPQPDQGGNQDVPPVDKVETPDPKDAGKPIIQDPPADDPSKTVEAKWPDTWRQDLAAGDEKLLNQLNRMASPADLFKSYRELQSKLARGELKAKAGDPPTDPEALKTWRAENGIPETPEKYEIKLDDGLVIGDEDKPAVDAFLKTMHEKNIPGSAVNSALNAYFQMQEQAITEEATMIAVNREKAQEELRKEYGSDFKGTMNAVSSLLNNTFGAEVATSIMASKLMDGTILGDNPAVIKGLASLAREINPAATVVPNAANPNMTIEAEIAELSKRIGTPEWFSDTKAQNRLTTLIDAQSRSKR